MDWIINWCYLLIFSIICESMIAMAVMKRIDHRIVASNFNLEDVRINSLLTVAS